ncbi:MAG: DNA mismatch repair endonuclease MutL, partial [Hyphomicrobiales bacterium]|nr:DNA mismatch repair endonuclease MutL [Hyphomicrobiales bacterium]
MPSVRLLDALTIDRIAAGEVVERPADAVKDLVENALDAGARRVEVAVEDGGRRVIRVADDGAGFAPEDLALAVERHATSKLPDGDLAAIASFGFRGEALPSIAAVSRLEIRTRAEGADGGLRLVVEQGVKGAVAPVGHPRGSTIEARDLFAATPARLKFLKSPRAEALACADAIRRLAIAHPQARFAFASDEGGAFDWPACPPGPQGARMRSGQALGPDFLDDALDIDATREGVRLTGLVAVPTHHRSNAQAQYFSVNGRAVRDRLLAGALAGAYADFLPAGRKAVAILDVACDPRFVDVNVHPAKTEVRFADPGLVRGLIVGAIRERLGAARHRASVGGGLAAAALFARDFGAAPNGYGSAHAPTGGFAEPAQ